MFLSYPLSLCCCAAVNTNVNVPDPNDDESWDEFVAAINSSLNELDFEFKSVFDEATGKKVYAMVRFHLPERACH